MKFTIIVPTYNLENYIEQCLKSILGQSFRDYELIIIDDASSDNTLDKIRHYQDEKVTVIETSGLRAPGLVRNEGLKRAKGDYILFLDGDDWYIHEKCLEFLAKACTGEDIIYFNFVYGKYGIATLNENTKKDYTASWCRAWRREFIGDLRYSNLKIGEDGEFAQKALEKKPVEKFYPEPLVYYNNPREGSIVWQFFRGEL